MPRERYVPIGPHGVHVSERNKHLKRAGIGAIGAAGSGALINPVVGVVISLAALYEVAKAVDHHEERINGR